MTDDNPTCCAASYNGQVVENASQSEAPAQQDGVNGSSKNAGEVAKEEMVKLDGGTFTMGTDDDVGFPEDGEGPPRDVTLDPFYIDQSCVSNLDFLEFVRDADYTTDAERFGWSFVFRHLVPTEDTQSIIQNVSEASWWVAVKGANWLRPYGPSSNIFENKELLKHPVTHVSWNDAAAYADWAGKRLPTEAEWEYAARGGLSGKRYPWGDELTPNGKHRCNIWQGDFPNKNLCEDGYFGTAPVNEFESNGYDLYNITGNVWEWCSDWFSPDYHTTSDYQNNNPTGPADGTNRVTRGGSYLCHRSWCNRYRVAARSKNSPESATGNIGFRTVLGASR